MLSMLGTLKNGAQASERPVLWLHAAENGRQHAFRDYITGLARAHPDDVTRRVWYNHPNPDDVMGSDNKAPFHFQGTMDLNQVKELIPLDKQNALYYFCGPIPFMKSIGQQLLQMGVERSALNFEAGRGGGGRQPRELRLHQSAWVVAHQIISTPGRLIALLDETS
eukprot:s542_g9.t2